MSKSRPVPVRLHQRKQQEHQIFHVISHQLSFQATGKIIFHLSSMSGSGTHYLVHTQPPASPDLFLCRPLFLWMPLKMWLIPHVCIRPDCGKHRLTAAGLYRTVRMVLDIDRWYDIATECLECKGCKKKYPAWSEDILGQLDMGHRSQFPALLTYMTYRYSCDNRVLRMMRERTLGSSATQLYKKLMEQHSEAWTQRVLQYLTACEPFTRSSLVQPPVFAEPPLLPALPKPKWLLAVYASDVIEEPVPVMRIFRPISLRA
ncbi:uncharacterized protein LOC130559073 isoform X1 [Triplophysa rosa]|uniref:uncharacterized protein LOC130555263 isoform X1 n=2 Tax=Triplophysa rosa TaxID=992332 RepID=UPI0025463631|nr:uncharacterized protein LOC130555263 isoform X1 [Triplophysa rosa]XP_057191342.1 uncharacterized protein LOC130555263 isoform X1 [Triplophysa rosa]XP_057197942.1 uncharacterized protein LOC130559073 isoform X1 [Triplophysa rosa]